MLKKIAIAVSALGLTAIPTSVAPAFAAESSVPESAVVCERPSRGYGYLTYTMDSTPVRTGPYQECRKDGPSVPANRDTHVFCKLSNDFGNLWYSVSVTSTGQRGWAYSSHFPAGVRDRVVWC
ncbi:hypothetical protein AR457_03135 [Streptomyces agglomeratus]|uniref:SH3b domain-containing protein n=1 Tax=Streptomyces agglomeratus TaxID=285458 RepID=A0A1E5P2A6_9ACTN|nr:hypothetical protein [Streptomyces agglomeratus]OEJ23637.1 hypothetical protein AS594_03240 [Streptomyces agglomeratus]OEJ43229.1 hypothetical protein AR457_03135 [Streptomyces agglomeratus]OEJ54850.1 hypothetical protein BGK72_32635 [Streptomyces agglomeratus]OEJ62221.1 hypothetical protein BGM19_33550 [Streptomyces agglomeratus]